MLLSQVLEGYTLDARARRLSPVTLDNYGYTFAKLRDQLGNPPFADITATDLRTVLASYPSLSSKSLLNMHAVMGALWAWAVREGLTPRNIVRDITPPKLHVQEVIPFTREDVRAMLKAAEASQPYDRPGKATTVNRLPMAVRNRAILLTLLDTGIRASELCTLTVAAVSLSLTRLTVQGKGAKERTVPFSGRTGQALWRYQAMRLSSREPYFFLTGAGGPLDRGDLLHIIKRVGERAGVDAYPHRFRHTFAITFLRNGGNVYVLQQMLGHTSLEMVRRYLHIVESDLESAHQQASPVANWRL